MEIQKAVKKTKELRQVWVKMQKSCQENEGIKTGLRGKVQKLSEIEASSDRFEVKRVKAVRRRAKFRQV
ncbi:hypothetical protein [Mesobacillus jeotgali]|uniref:Uncharacterized protein n=1 Tax=Mesobacillus jeotgali TaxID=129985 RepID=A0ABY9VJ53_9BACI|nr:hypothetical protein [Mesobacillus jeotgali]WNF23688.1 hypothetical protein RH061_04025 [Mesobacillus jeotgali]